MLAIKKYIEQNWNSLFLLYDQGIENIQKFAFIRTIISQILSYCIICNPYTKNYYYENYLPAA